MLNTQSRGPYVSSGGRRHDGVADVSSSSSPDSTRATPTAPGAVHDTEHSYHIPPPVERLDDAHRFHCYRLNCNLSGGTVDVTIDRVRTPLATDQVLVCDGNDAVQMMYSEFCRKRVTIPKDHRWLFMGVVCRWSIEM